MHKYVRNLIKFPFEKIGLSFCRSTGSFEANFDIGREYQDPKDSLPRFCLKKTPDSPYTQSGTEFTVDNGKSILKEMVYFSHLTLLKLCKQYQFNSVLDIGSHERRHARIFEHVGKKVTTIEIAPGYEADYTKDYLEQKFDGPFDAIWCSQIYEHQRNPGLFLDKIFDDLKEGGVLALTVPFQIDRNLCFGHINPSSPSILIYQLVCAGFDCSQIALKVYNGFIGVVLVKKFNGIKRRKPFGSLPLKGIRKDFVENTKDEIFPGMEKAFPFPIQYPHCNKKITAINWKNPI